eukprot:GHVP01009663.1.p1 GENE.GHVP01009663.1~~GHVP01009663.1.p1  ORF type:complete len:566 (-),score=139.65 GHVP01009663.1:64-1761(-)
MKKEAEGPASVRHPERKAKRLQEVGKSLLGKTSEIIIRNLSYDLEEPEIRELVSQYNPVDVRLGKKDGKFAGFAFCTFGTKDEAQKVVSQLSKRMVGGRRLGVALAVGKHEHQSIEQKLVELKKSGNEKVSESPFKRKRSASEIASKKKVKPNEEKNVNKNGKNDKKNDNKNDNKNEKKNDNKNDKNDKKSQKRKDTTGEKKMKELSLDVKEGRSVFVWNMPYDITQEDLMDKLKTYGKILRITINKKKESQEPSGTGFVEFKDALSVDNLLIVDGKGERAHTQEKLLYKTKGVVSELHSLPIEGDAVIVRGRRLRFSKALPKEEAQNKEHCTKIAKEIFGGSVKDMRAPSKNLAFLIRQGIIDSPPKEGPVDKTEEDKWIVLKKKIGDPNYFLNPLRLSVQKLPFTMGKNGLKIAAAKLLLSTKESRELLVKNEKLIEKLRKKKHIPGRDVRKQSQANDILEKEYVFGDDENENSKEHYTKLSMDAMRRLAKDALRSVSLVEEKDPVKKLKAPSKGFGFIDCCNHAIAKMLKVLIRNKTKFHAEFVMESVNAIQKQDFKKEDKK